MQANKKWLKPFTVTFSSLCLLCSSVAPVFAAEEQVTYANVLSSTARMVQGLDPAGKQGGQDTTENHVSASQDTSNPFKNLQHVVNPPWMKQETTEIHSAQASRSVSTLADQTYTMAYLNTLSYPALIDLISSVNWWQIPELFNYNNDTYAFYNDQNRMQALINALATKGAQYTANDDKGIPTLVEVLRSAFYLGYYNTQLNYLNNNTYKAKLFPALKAIASNSAFKFGTTKQEGVIASFGMMVGNSSVNTEIIQLSVPILVNYNQNIAQYAQDRNKSGAFYEVIKGIGYDLMWTFNNTEKAAFKKKIDPYLAEIEKLALLGNPNANNSWLINNGLYYMGYLGEYHTNPQKGNVVLTQAMSLYPYLSEQHLTAASFIDYLFGGVNANGVNINFQQLIAAGKAKYLPNTYSFDDGAYIFRTGSNVTTEKIQRLYWASKEVKAQFHRMNGSDRELELGNPDDILTVVIYNSPAEYTMNSILYGYDTNNGGMYIEGDGTFFTYERTTQESIYSLEELFRHEYTHYLQGRYAVPGPWGSGPIYQNERLTWFEEGNAELMAGATRLTNILPRKSVVSNIANTPSSSWYTANQTLHSKYGSFDFYHYSFALQYMMHGKKWDKYNNLFKALRSNNVTGYDSLISAWSNDTQFNTDYQSEIQSLVNAYPNLTTPQVADDYLLQPEAKNNSEIYSEITTATGLTNVETATHKSPYFDTFTLHGTYTGSASQGEVADWKTMNNIANGFLTTMNGYAWSGYKTLTSYFTNYRVNAAGKFEYDVVFHGKSSTANAVNQPPVSKVNGPYSGQAGQTINFSSQGSTDPDGTITSYLWDFGDGTTSTAANPTHAYQAAGNFNVKLTVTDNGGLTNVQQTTATITTVPVNQPPQANVNGPYSGKAGTAIAFSSQGSVDPDGTIASYSWNFGDGTPTNSNANPNHTYQQAGTYTVTLTVTDNKGLTNSQSVAVTVAPPDPVGDITTESEPNNSFNQANGPVAMHKLVSGTSANGSDVDIFYFDVTTAANLTITLDEFGKQGLNWLLYKDSDLQNYVSYPNVSSPDKLVGTYNAGVGRYYIYIYNFSSLQIPYTIQID
ncbi:collagenase [Paenibacillus sp. N1-5-1-14]|uniref:collagenase n=1 Tax=Paenibacillus radicibacter TaxID=2972488 RepID=UPI002158C603|nr:collagenase [Paenibacillus radicibacter]MCR8645314.1 collagenase [Paenibacillus radicibacter]